MPLPMASAPPQDRHDTFVTIPVGSPPVLMVAGRTAPPPVVPDSLWPSTGTGVEVAAVPAAVVVVAEVVADAEGVADADGVVTDKLAVGVVAGATELAATDDGLSAGVLALDTLPLAAQPASSRQEATYAGMARRDISQRLAGIDRVTTPNVAHFSRLRACFRIRRFSGARLAGAELGAAAAELGDEVTVAGDGCVVDAAAAVAGADPAVGDEDVAEAGGGDEEDVAPGRDRDRAPAVAGAGEGRVGQREDHPAVADAVPVDHVVADRHGRAGPAVAVVEQGDAERAGGGVGRHHRLDGTGLADRV